LDRVLKVSPGDTSLPLMLEPTLSCLCGLDTLSFELGYPFRKATVKGEQYLHHNTPLSKWQRITTLPPRKHETAISAGVKKSQNCTLTLVRTSVSTQPELQSDKTEHSRDHERKSESVTVRPSCVSQLGDGGGETEANRDRSGRWSSSALIDHWCGSHGRRFPRSGGSNQGLIIARVPREPTKSE